MRASLITLAIVTAACAAVASLALAAAPAPAPAAPAATAEPTDYWALVATTDAPDLNVYRQANATLPPPQPGEDRVVFIGDSITENWQRTFNQNYPGKSYYIGRGRTSETTWHMLIRFHPDIVNLQPKVVVIMAGVNDVAGNAGAVTPENIHDNFISMFQIAKANNIKVVLVSTLPATRFFWQGGITDASQQVKRLVEWEKDYAAKNGIYFVNAFDRFKDDKDGMPTYYSSDTVHPNNDAYAILSQMVEGEIQKALKGLPNTQEVIVAPPIPDTPARGGRRGAAAGGAAAPAAGGAAAAPAAGGAAPAAGAGRAGGGGGRGGRGPIVAPPPTQNVIDHGLPIPDGVLPIKTASNAVIYVPRIATKPAIVSEDGRGPSSPYWSVAIQADPADLKVFADANAKLALPKPGDNRVVFLGDSITEKWQKESPSLFANKPNYINRASTSESTQQMLVRFRPDVIKLGAKVVVLQAGVGDVAGNTGDVSDSYIHDNFAAIVDLAKVNNIKLVWISTLPADKLFWRPDLQPAQRIADLVKWEKDYASKNGAAFVDAYTPLKDDKGGLASKYTADGVHPNADGYKLLSSLVTPEIEKALK